MVLSKLSTELYSIHHLSREDSKSIEDFQIFNPKGKGLEIYLKKAAIAEEENNNARTYLIKDVSTKEIVAYFTLKSGIITKKTSWFYFDNITGIELANFAVNDAYRSANDVIPQLGRYIFITFIHPLAYEISSLLGAQYLYIFALKQDKLMNHYSSMGFGRFPQKLEKFIHKHIRPRYDKGCIFMYQAISDSKPE